MDILKISYTNFASLVQNLLNVPYEKELFFQVSLSVRYPIICSRRRCVHNLTPKLCFSLQEVFPTNYGSAYDQRLQQLVSEFLCRLEQLLPVPDLQQVLTAGHTLTDTYFTCMGINNQTSNEVVRFQSSFWITSRNTLFLTIITGS